MKLQDLKETARARAAAEAGRGQSARDWERSLPPEEREYAQVLSRHGFKRQPDGKYYKTAGVGTIQIDKHGHWVHLGVDKGYEGGADFEGTTVMTLDRHLINTLWPRTA